MVYANLQPLGQHSPRVTPMAGGLLPHLLTLTTHTITCVGGSFLLLSPAVASAFQFQKQSALRCPDFPLASPLSSPPRPSSAHHSTCRADESRKKRRRRKRPATNQGSAFPHAKVIKLFHSANNFNTLFALFIRKKEGEERGRSCA